MPDKTKSRTEWQITFFVPHEERELAKDIAKRTGLKVQEVYRRSFTIGLERMDRVEEVTVQ